MNYLNRIDLPNIEFVNLYDIFSKDSEEEFPDELIVRAPKRYIRNMQNPFEYYNDVEFKRRYRFSKHSVLQGILPRYIIKNTRTSYEN